MSEVDDEAQLEALADEIAAEDAERSEQLEQQKEEQEEQLQRGGGGGGGDVGGGPAAAPTVQQCWEAAVDLNSNQTYWFNRATGVSQWHPPPGWAPGDGNPAPQQQQPPQQPQRPSLEQPGLYYRDAVGQLQGPFAVEDLQQWRGMLPMNLPILELTAGESGGGEAAGGWVPPRDLATLLGDEELLDWWKMDNPEAAAWPGSAPPAPAVAAERQQGSAHSLAQAVLSGLPADDETVAVARLAAASGKSIQEVAEWGRRRGGEDYSVTAYRVAARGRIQAEGSGQVSCAGMCGVVTCAWNRQQRVRWGCSRNDCCNYHRATVPCPLSPPHTHAHSPPPPAA